MRTLVEVFWPGHVKDTFTLMNTGGWAHSTHLSYEHRCRARWGAALGEPIHGSATCAFRWAMGMEPRQGIPWSWRSGPLATPHLYTPTPAPTGSCACCMAASPVGSLALRCRMLGLLVCLKCHQGRGTCYGMSAGVESGDWQGAVPGCWHAASGSIECQHSGLQVDAGIQATALRQDTSLSCSPRVLLIPVRAQHKFMYWHSMPLQMAWYASCICHPQR